MKKKPLVTVLMPCYNAMPFLIEALESIINQTYTNLEILCINDGSTDDTGKVLERFAKQDSRVKVVHNETNLKLIKSLNKGISLANGEYIARMDADDIAVEDRIQVQMNYFNQNPEIDVVCSASINMTEEGKAVSQNLPRNYSPIGSLYASFMFVPIGHPEVTIKTKLLRENNFLEEEYAIHTEDYELWSRLLRKKYKLVNIDKKLHYYRVNSQSVSRKFTKLQDKNFVECAKRHYYAYSGIEYSTKVVNVLVNRIGKKTLTVEHLKKGLVEMKKFKKFFIQKENIRDTKTHSEINTIYKTHLFDILFQSFKRSNGKVRVFVFFQFVKSAHLFMSKSSRKYLKTKSLKY